MHAIFFTVLIYNVMQVQGSLNNESILIFVTGQLIMGENTNPLLFAQVLSC